MLEDIVWQLPVIQSNKTDHDWTHPKAKYHAFVDYNSVCGRHRQDTDFFETGIEESKLMVNKELACKACLNQVLK